MKLKRSSKSEGSLSATTLSCLNAKKDQMKIKIKFGLLASCLVFACATYSMAQGHSIHNSENGLAVQEHASSGKLVQLVRAGTKQFLDVNNATAAGYATLLGCVAGTDHGAMGCALRQQHGAPAISRSIPRNRKPSSMSLPMAR